MQPPRYILPIIVFAQFCCTSLWFAGNAVMTDLISQFMLSPSALGHLTSAVQFGFIAGTLIFALLSVADRYSPSKVFLICALLGAGSNSLIIVESHALWSLISLRFMTGFFLAGIYPVGMKIASDYFNKGLGKSLGYLVGALVLGTAFPHLVKSLGSTLSWNAVIIATSVLACTGGVLLYLLVPDGPYRQAAQKIKLSAIGEVFSVAEFRKAAFGYFGHMWELYAFWAFVPVMLAAYPFTDSTFNLSTWSFMIIGVGSLSCIAGGYLSMSFGSKHVATLALLGSGICCLLSPFSFQLPAPLFLSFLIFWGITVIMDSPLFSTLVAHSANPQIKGTALTIVNCIGFAITIISIQLITYLKEVINIQYVFLILSIGPILGLINLGFPKKSNSRT